MLITESSFETSYLILINIPFGIPTFSTYFFCIHRYSAPCCHYLAVIRTTRVMASLSMVRQGHATIRRDLFECSINILYSSFYLSHSWLRQFSLYQHPRLRLRPRLRVRIMQLFQRVAQQRLPTDGRAISATQISLLTINGSHGIVLHL